MVSDCRYFCKFFEYFPQLKTFLLHFGLCVCVVAYIVVGAYVIRDIEAVKIEQLNLQPSFEAAVGYKHRASRNGSNDPNASNSKTKHHLSRSRKCVIHAIASLSSGGKCDIHTQSFFDNVHQCYENDLNDSLQRYSAEEYNKSLLANTIHRPRSKATAYRETYKDWEYWTLKDSIIFCFTLITTIGYGNVAPETTAGRLFVILYGFIGIPFTMLIVADIGKFIAEFLRILLRSWCRFYRSLHSFALFSCNFGPSSGDKTRPKPQNELNYTRLQPGNAEKTTVDTESLCEEGRLTGEPVILLLAFALYIVAGSVIFSLYEPNMDFVKDLIFGEFLKPFKKSEFFSKVLKNADLFQNLKNEDKAVAIYFNFITLMTIGLGDVVPQNQTYLVITLIYCTIGLALTTCAVETGADYLRKLHYYGRKLKEVENLHIWFGSKRLTIKQLVRSMGDQFELPVEKLDRLNLDYFVEKAIQVESGHMITLRNEKDSVKPKSTTSIYSPTDGDIIYIDEDEKQKRPLSK